MIKRSWVFKRLEFSTMIKDKRLLITGVKNPAHFLIYFWKQSGLAERQKVIKILSNTIGTIEINILRTFVLETYSTFILFTSGFFLTLWFCFDSPNCFWELIILKAKILPFKFWTFKIKLAIFIMRGYLLSSNEFKFYFSIFYLN